MQVDPTNIELLYQLAKGDAVYVIAAYGILWAAFVVYVSMVLRRIMRLEKEVALLEGAVERKA